MCAEKIECFTNPSKVGDITLMCKQSTPDHLSDGQWPSMRLGFKQQPGKGAMASPPPLPEQNPL